MLMSMDDDVTKAFERAPMRAIIGVEDVTRRFISQSGIVLNSQQHHEIARQIFDHIDSTFTEFEGFVSKLPIFHTLVDHEKYFDTYGRVSNTGRNLQIATKEYAVGIFLDCHAQGIFLKHRTPYLLETVKDGWFLLYNSLGGHILTTV